MHLLPSSHAVPSGAAGFVQAPEDGSHVPAVWQVPEAMHTIGAPAVHAPAAQVSPVVHLFPSSQLVPSSLLGFEQAPVPGSQTPALWHWSSAVQATALPATQPPAWHTSPIVHALPSLHVDPSAFAGLLHTPVDGSHIPAT